MCVFIFSKFDIHTMNYCIAVNTQRNLGSLCEAVNMIIAQTPKLFCSRLRGINNFFIRPAEDIIKLGMGVSSTFKTFNSSQIIQLQAFGYLSRLEQRNGLGMRRPKKQTKTSGA